MDTGTDKIPDSDADGQWLTYGELASIRRIDRHSAVKLVTRHRWRRQKDNRGILRILVPAEWAASRDKGTDTGTDEGTDTTRAISALQEGMATLREQLADANGRAKQAESRAESAENDRRAAESRAESANARAEVAESRQRWAEDRVEGLRYLLAEAERRAAGAEDGRKAVLAHADALERAEFERLGRGLLARLRAAWRGE